MSLSFKSLFLLLFTFCALLLAASTLFAWTGPTGTPPNNNTPPPINEGAFNQVKHAGLSLDALAVFGHTLLNNGKVTYLNFGANARGAGYGFRDNAGTMEFKNDGGPWQPIGGSGGGGIGVGQAWQDLTATRKSGITYTNSSGKPIMVAVTCNLNGGFVASINGVVAMRYPAVNAPLSPSFIVPDGSTYSITCPVGIPSWAELR